MTTHFINYDYAPLIEVDIDEETAAPFIKEMVEFWSNWEREVSAAHGDYTAAWCKRLALFCLERQRPPREDDEGWRPLDGSHGITARNFYVFDWIEEELIEIS